MRFFCTCDCSKVRGELEERSREMRGLKADLGDLWDRFERLQGRLAKRGELKRDESAPSEPHPESPAERDRRLNEEIYNSRRPAHALQSRDNGG